MTQKNNDQRVVDYEPLLSGEFVIKYKIDPGFDKTKQIEKSMLSDHGVVVLSHSRGILNEFVHHFKEFFRKKHNIRTLILYKSILITMKKQKNFGYVGNLSGQ